MEDKNYYEILGVDENATEEEINKAFKKLALKWHPDRWSQGTDEEKKTAEEKFKQYSEAKDVLTNPKKRKEYDMQRNGMPNMGGFSNPFADFFNQHAQYVMKGDDINVEVQISFKESYEGVKKTIRFKRKEHCQHCNGTGSQDGRKDTCPYCNGSGFETHTQQRGNMIFQTRTHCSHCHGTGQVVKNPCHHCNGTGLVEVDAVETFDVPAGVFDNAAVTLHGHGDAPSGEGEYGDLILHFSVSYDPYFERTDFKNVVHYEELPFSKALLGCDIECKKPDGGTIKIKLPELTEDGQEFVQYGLGFNDLIHGTGKGNYTIIIKYKYPRRLTDKQKKLLKDFEND